MRESPQPLSPPLLLLRSLHEPSFLFSRLQPLGDALAAGAADGGDDGDQPESRYPLGALSHVQHLRDAPMMPSLRPVPPQSGSLRLSVGPPASPGLDPEPPQEDVPGVLPQPQPAFSCQDFS